MSNQPITVSMLVSRSAEMFRRALKSIMVSQSPDELLLFPASGLDWSLEEEIEDLSPDNVSVRVIEQQPAKITDPARARAYYPGIDPDFLVKKWAHTHDLVVRSVLEAAHGWVRMCDDDDEMFFDVREVIDEAPEDVGVINGDFFYCDFVRCVWEKRGGQVQVGRKSGAQGSTNCFRKRAVLEASEHWEPGPWPDWQLTYHMTKLGWRNMYVPEVFSIQHWHGKNSSKARSGYISWENLERNLGSWWNGGRAK